jgi:hypothetical protein
MSPYFDNVVIATSYIGPMLQSQGSVSGHSYSTNFTTNENPISDTGWWTPASGSNWGSVKVASNFAQGSPYWTIRFGE